MLLLNGRTIWKISFCWLFLSRKKVILCIIISRSVLKRIISVVMILKVVLVVVGKQVTTGCWSSTRASLTLLLLELLMCTRSCICSWTVRSISTTAWSYGACWCLMRLVYLMVWSEGSSSAMSAREGQNINCLSVVKQNGQGCDVCSHGRDNCDYVPWCHIVKRRDVKGAAYGRMQPGQHHGKLVGLP